MQGTTISTLYVRGIWLDRGLPEEGYLRRLPVLRELQANGGLELTRQVTFLVGENGVGKSTLLEALAVAMGFNPEGGTVNFNFSTADSHSELYRYLTVSRGARRPRDGFFLRAESFYNVATTVDRLNRDGPPLLDSYGGVSLHRQSHGESFLSLMRHRFGGNGLYLLDEPEAALSPTGQMTMLCLLQELVERNSQFIISTHSPILMTFPGAQVLELSERGIQAVPYWKSAHFQLTKRFLDAPEQMLQSLLGTAL